ncbi:MAG: sigma-70 family RNA polymerase sigma factor [Saprospiraceae bacterium]|nr:sigma-70 family RNA polymerase sigma factor [Saprospiraceae bacterium]
MNLEKHSEHLIGKAHVGNQQAINELFSLWYERVYNMAWKYFGEEEVAMDVCQQTFVTVHRKLHHLEDASKFKYWLYRTVINQCHMESRKRKTLHQAQEKFIQRQFQPVQEQPDEIYHRTERSKVVLAALQQLPEEQRTIILMKEYEDLTFREIAETLGISEGTAKSRLYYGLKNLRNILLNNRITKEYNYE